MCAACPRACRSFDLVSHIAEEKEKSCVLVCVKMEGEKKGSKVKRQKGSVMSIFMQADGVDFLLMGLGFIGAVSDGFATPVMLFFISKLVNSVGTASTGNIDSFTHNIKKV